MLSLTLIKGKPPSTSRDVQVFTNLLQLLGLQKKSYCSLGLVSRLVTSFGLATAGPWLPRVVEMQLQIWSPGCTVARVYLVWVSLETLHLIVVLSA